MSEKDLRIHTDEFGVLRIFEGGQEISADDLKPSKLRNARTVFDHDGGTHLLYARRSALKLFRAVLAYMECTDTSQLAELSAAIDVGYLDLRPAQIGEPAVEIINVVHATRQGESPRREFRFVERKCEAAS